MAAQRARSTSAALKGKTVLITGGTGTFGNALVTRLLKEDTAKKIIIFSRDEFKQSKMQAAYHDPKKKLRFFLGDIRDLSRLKRAFQGVDIVVHAAALKQVPATEYNPFEAVQTNIIGSQNVVDAALDSGVEKAILISSDKAVQPVNLYGATKLAAEKLFVAANFYRNPTHDTAFSVVRYGNVVGSRGSFIELLRTQRESGTITLTDERMTRFWITIDRVMDIVLGALDQMDGGETFVPKMKNMAIIDVIKLLTPDCKVRLVGIRPGEKVHEVLVTEHEALRTRDLPDAYVIEPEFLADRGDWLKKKTRVAPDLNFASNNPAFLLSEKEARSILIL